MSARLVALDEGPDILLDRILVVVGRHPACDARLDSLRVSRHHCCVMHDHGEVVVRDLGSTNGIRINGQRVETGRLRPGDELTIAHIRYRLDHGQGHDQALTDSLGSQPGSLRESPSFEKAEVSVTPGDFLLSPFPTDENALAAAVRKILPSAVAEKCRIQVIVQMTQDEESNGDSRAAVSEAKATGNRPE
jgi:predicted component of type VI protein secretion system